MNQPVNTIALQEPCMIVLAGAAGSGKSTFAAQHFTPECVLSSDAIRAELSGDASDQSISAQAFALLYRRLTEHLQAGQTRVVDATNATEDEWRALVKIARERYLRPYALVMDTPLETCLTRAAARTDRSVPSEIVREQHRGVVKHGPIEGSKSFDRVIRIDPHQDYRFVFQPYEGVRPDLRGPFDIVGDLHGCLDELLELLKRLGYRQRGQVTWAGVSDVPLIQAPEGRRLISLGDLTDRGPHSLRTFALIASMVERGDALCLPGNHEAKLKRLLRGKGKWSGGADTTRLELERLSNWQREATEGAMLGFIKGLPHHYVLDGGALVLAHAGLPEHMHGRDSGEVRSFAYYGDVDGTFDEHGAPVHRDWVADYAGEARVVYGHLVASEARWRNSTMALDTGCVFGGSLSALRWPELEIVSVPAQRTWCAPRQVNRLD